MDRKIRAGLVPALFFAALALAAGIAGYFSIGSGPKPRAVAPPVQPAFVRGVVQSVASDRLTLTTDSGPLELRLAPDAAFEALRATSFGSIAVGDWINGGAIANAQTLFALSGIVVIPPSQLGAPR